MERPWGRTVRAVALLVFTATAFLPLHACLASPRPGAQPSGGTYVPARVVADAARRPDGGGLRGFVWSTRAVYPYLLAPLWAALLLAAELAGRRGRRAAGALALALSVGVAAFELAYIRTDYTGVLPRAVLAQEQYVAWGVVVLLLFGRRPGRGFLEPEAAVSAQALLACFHAFTFPAADVRRYLAAGHGLGPVLDTLVTNYRPAFVVAVAALAAVALPGYLRPAAGPPPDAGPAAR
jgi:hypothetical protein